MFVCNFKLDKKVIKYIVITLIVLIMVGVFIIVGYRFVKSISKVTVNDETNYNNEFIEINSNNYTDILKDSHDNIDKYVGKKIKFVGFVYRLYDFSENQFVLGREMVISSNNQVVVVGFLCESNMISNFKERSWVEIEGVIVKGDYHGDMPIVNVTNIHEVDTPCDELVYPPSDTYISTEL